ncbi:MAG: iron-containing alcohol dehydrogenase [Syntrophothermus sp.]
MTEDFVWIDAGRTVILRRAGLAAADEVLAEHGIAEFDLLSTERALAGARRLAAAATAIHEVAPGQVPGLAAALLPYAAGERPLVALGGGRVIDVAKAVAAVTGAAVAAIPTTMSGAEMSASHRLPAGHEERVAARVRPRLVIADPELMTSAPEARLRASSLNALAHGADCLYTPLANPVSRMTALRGAELIATALDQTPAARARSDLALGSLLCGYAIDSAKAGLHHPVCQTLVRICGIPHAETNAAVLPRSAAFLAPRVPDLFDQLAAALGADRAGLEARLLELGGRPAGLGALGADRARLGEVIETALARPELGAVPGAPVGARDLEALIESAW